ncbi:hypothetical protein HBA55_19090 [Pseudomaricurvus alkylphenolicus]|uniref:hypothetical protein n=1 Tax=Pseudomaricurvus alkylphenolicus TaxID=1306991 RepID=UPI001423719E|nr:hypothetical protein [Pseudomaricurvus alkylphenolicus]NIB41719.1 hypothetical protein [Pseudomaricurvus alkylphenolicus]
MNEYEKSAGRPLEIIVGIISLGISIILLLAFGFLVLKANVGWPMLLGGLFLGLLCYWFGNIAVRLFLNRKNSQGGLLSSSGLMFWCVFLGLGSVGMVVMGIWGGQLGTVLGGAGMLIACCYGWRIGSNRKMKGKSI